MRKVISGRCNGSTLRSDLNAQEFLAKGSIPNSNISDRACDEEVRASCGEDDVVHACKVASAPKLRLHVHGDPVP